MSSADELDIDEETLAPAPQDAPADFRERLVLALKTTDSATLAAAESDFRGCYNSPDEYVREALARYLPAWLAWCLNYAPFERLLAAHQYETRCVIWTIALKDQVLVFESPELSAARGRQSSRDSSPR